MKPSLPIPFLVTGIFVTRGASWVLGTSGALAKLLALRLFCLVVFAVRLLSGVLIAKRLPALRTILGLKLALLAAGAVLALVYGPFDDGDRVAAVMTGMMLVAAMAMQNALHRIHMEALPPTHRMQPVVGSRRRNALMYGAIIVKQCCS